MAGVLALAAPLVMAWEGLRLQTYVDVTGTPTVCWGETRGVQWRTYTRAECEALLNRSLEEHAAQVLDCLRPGTPLEVKAAFASFAYNVGAANACNSSAARKARAGDYRGACDGLMAWVYSKGRRLQGLVNRRAAERELCLKGVA